jgi:hypothetical protein
MWRYLAVIVAAACACLAAAGARASGDFGCDPSWKLDHPYLTDCDSIAFLTPANDTRVNLLILTGVPTAPAHAEPAEWPKFGWRGLKGWMIPPREQDGEFVEGEGSRCRSNRSGAAEFRTAVDAATKLTPEERARLIAARAALDCGGASASLHGGGMFKTVWSGARRVRSAMLRLLATAPPALAGRSGTAAAFELYLEGAGAFYRGDFETAAAVFHGLAGVREPWVREASAYMVGRAALNRAQIDSFDEYGLLKTPAAADRAALDESERALGAYLKAYPRGRYSASARGLLRRAYWLGGDTEKLTAQYVAALKAVPGGDTEAALALTEEIDSKLLNDADPARLTDPVLLAVEDLRRMRVYRNEADQPVSELSLAQLEAQKPQFASRPELHGYLLATHALYVRRDPAEALRRLDGARVPARSPLSFSALMLRGMAREMRNEAELRKDWRSLLASAPGPGERSAAELALAMHEERKGGIDALFQTGSPLRTLILRKMLLAYVADAPLLRQQARAPDASAGERDVALFALLYKELSRGRYADFVADLALVPGDAAAEANFWDLLLQERLPAGVFARALTLGDYGCPALRDTAAALARDGGNIRARLCLADFFRANGFDQFPLDTAPPKDELGGTAPGRWGPAYVRFDVYRSIIDDPRARADEKAYALYRAVHCYAPAGYSSCGGEQVPEATRRAWFQRLKRDYPASRWARALRYYW